MSRLNQHEREALVSVDDQALIREILNATVDSVGFEEIQDRLR